MRKIELIDEALARGARPADACAMLQIAERTYYNYKRSLRQTGSCADRRPCSEHPPPSWRYSDEYRAQLVALCNRPEYAALTPCEICCDQLDNHGRYICSVSTLYNILREHDQSVRRDRTRRPSRHRPPAVYADGPNQVWMWDITYIKSHIRGLHYYLYVFTDLYDRSVVGWGLYTEESAENASLLIRSICMEQRRLSTQPLILHSDNGAVMKSSLMLSTLTKLGITASFSRPRVSNDNPYAESLFKTLKTRYDYPAEGFASLEDARAYITGFVEWYNHEHRHRSLNYVTPLQRRRGEDKAILAQRTRIHREASKSSPQRWHGRNSRDWSLPDQVRLGHGEDAELIDPPPLQDEICMDIFSLKTM